MRRDATRRHAARRDTAREITSFTLARRKLRRLVSVRRGGCCGHKPTAFIIYNYRALAMITRLRSA